MHPFVSWNVLACANDIAIVGYIFCAHASSSTNVIPRMNAVREKMLEIQVYATFYNLIRLFAMINLRKFNFLDMTRVVTYDSGKLIVCHNTVRVH